jgi:Protein of unknown function, DUF417
VKRAGKWWSSWTDRRAVTRGVSERPTSTKRRDDQPTTRPIVERVVSLSTIDAIASVLGRYGLVVVIGWIGALKFADFEAHQIQPLVAHSPFMGWLYDFLPVYTSQPY